MAVTYQEPQQIDPLTMRLRWSSDATQPVPFRVFVNGVQVAAFSSGDGNGQFDLNVPVGNAPFVEVLDDASKIPALAFPGEATLYWLASSGATQYVVEEYVSAVWTERATIPAQGRGSFTWQSRWLEDVTTHQFRITAKDAAGNSSSVLSFSILMVRVPDVPEVSYSYDAGTGVVTVSAA